MKKIAFLELAHVFSNQVKLPYSTGCVWSYCRLNPIIQEHYSFDVRDWHYLMDENFEVDNLVEQLKDIDILGISYFVWNVDMSDEIAEKVKKINPKCIIVYGGLGMPKWGRCDQFMKDRHWIDFIVHNEGEIVFENLLVALAKKTPLEFVRGITTRFFVNPLETRVKDINNMPSPYLDGLFDDLYDVSDKKYTFEALIEPERGCPYTCTFCEVGDKHFTKIEKQSNEKIFKEIDWISEHKIDYMFIINNNFGMFPSHKNLTQYIIDKRDNTGYPNALNITWAKYKKPFLFETAKMMHNAKLLKGVTIALQSMNPDTLNAVQRNNVEAHELKNVIVKLKELKIPPYIEMILGLPEESLESFKSGLYRLLDEFDYHSYIGIYIMVALPNTPFSDPDYLNKYGIKLVKTSPAFFHHEQTPEKLLKDTNTLVVASNKLSFDDYIEATLWKWFIVSTHFLGWTRIISIEFKEQFDVTFEEFYNNLFEWFQKTETSILHQEYYITEKMVRKVFDREIPWGRKIKEVSKIYWEYEEATAMQIAQNKSLFYDEINTYIKDYYNFDSCQSIEEIIKKQYHKMKDPYIEYDGDIEKWCKECMWWGRRVERFFVGENL